MSKARTSSNNPAALSPDQLAEVVGKMSDILVHFDELLTSHEESISHLFSRVISLEKGVFNGKATKTLITTP